MNEKYDALKEAIVDGDDEEAVEIAKTLVNEGTDPAAIFSECVEPTLNEMGDQFAALEIFLPDLMMAGSCVTAIQDELMPLMIANSETTIKKGKVVIATVQGDIHDIGKNMVALMLGVNGFDTYDLGVDVKPLDIISKAEEVDADIVCLSGLMMPSLPYMKETIEQIRANSRLAHTKVMVGGGSVTETWANSNGADGYSDDAAAAVKLAMSLVS